MKAYVVDAVNMVKDFDDYTNPEWETLCKEQGTILHLQAFCLNFNNGFIKTNTDVIKIF